MLLRCSNSVVDLNILLADATRGSAAHVRELDIARSPSCVTTPRAEMDGRDTKALLSLMASLHNCIREPKVRIGCETHTSKISQGKPRSEMVRYMDGRRCALDWKKLCRVALGSTSRRGCRGRGLEDLLMHAAALHHRKPGELSLERSTKRIITRNCR